MFSAPRPPHLSDYGDWQTEHRDGVLVSILIKWESQSHSGLGREIFDKELLYIHCESNCTVGEGLFH